MRPLSEQLRLVLPALFALLMLLVSSVQLQITGLMLAPNVAFVMSLLVASMYPAAWPRGFAFALGMLQDVLFGTPLGAQALLTLLLVTLTRSQASRQQNLSFHLRWLEASGVLIVWQGLLWGMMHFVSPDAASLRSLLRGGLASILWYPLFYAIVTRLCATLPAVK